ncbi:MAG: hypothetical protein EBW74_13195, partial [Betaproteobacteria bacterium]|nr:hypothetical protein [Betaproteobacteria bacterium]
MATSKLFTVAGISKREGEYKVRFANDVMRVKVLMKGGHEDVRLVELDQPSTKLEAVKVLRTMAEFSEAAHQRYHHSHAYEAGYLQSVLVHYIQHMPKRVQKQLIAD